MILALLNFEFHKYIKSNKFIGPLIALLGFLAASYSIAPLSILSSFSLSSLWLYLIMMWIGYTYNDVKITATEQVVYLRVKKKSNIWLSKILFMFLICFVATLICLSYPLITNVINNNHLFDRPVEPNDILISILFHFLFGCVGSLIGLFLNERIISNRKLAVCYIALIGITTIVKDSIEDKQPIMQFITWILPPLNHAAGVLGQMEHLSYGVLMKPILLIILYIMVQAILYIQLMKYRLFE